MYKQKVFPNKLTLITIPKPSATTTTVLVLVACGSKYETKNINGISHFLEHMCFKGTKRRPRAIDIASELDALGAQYNAFTGEELTGYYAKVDPTHIEQAIDIVADIYVHQIFRPSEIKKESGVIIEEINMYEDNPQRKVHDNFTSLLYGDQPAGWNIAGTKDIVSKINATNLSNYHKKHYVAEATTVIVSGNLNEKKVEQEVRKHFSKIRTSKKQQKKKIKEVQSKPNLAIEYKKTDQSHMVLGFRTFSASDKRVPALNVLATVLGRGMSSRLFNKIREQMGAAYYVSAHPNYYTDHGFLGINVGANNQKTKEVLQAILVECSKFKTQLITKKELKKAQDYMIGNLSLNLETTDELGWFFGEQGIIRKNIKTPQEVIKAIKSVTAKEVQEVAREIFQDKHLNTALIGPVKSDKGFVSLLTL
tara:strand:- start:797 stop:2062 length:1266 start_codon:yes stop_codon:yes gene_type:complete